MLVKDLRDNGISVLASGILCLEHHTKENMQEDVDFLVGLNSDFVQFMLFTPLPVTALYKKLKKCGQLKFDLPFEEWHGQKTLNWDHPHFTGQEAEKWVWSSFAKDFEENSSSLYRMIDTAFRGYETLKAIKKRDATQERRMQQLRERAHDYGLALPAIAKFANNEIAKERAFDLDKRMWAAFGKKSLNDRFSRKLAAVFMAQWKLRVKMLGDMRQPKTIVTEYRSGLEKVKPIRASKRGSGGLSDEAIKMSRSAAAIVSTDR